MRICSVVNRGNAPYSSPVSADASGSAEVTSELLSDLRRPGTTRSRGARRSSRAVMRSEHFIVEMLRGCELVDQCPVGGKKFGAPTFDERGRVPAVRVKVGTVVLAQSIPD